MKNFHLHGQLIADCHYLGRFDLCHVLLHKNAAVPWFILVPETEFTDVLDLPAGPRNLAMSEAALISEFIKNTLGYSKVNFAGIGNAVPQLHLHVVGRRPDDPCWPAPVWGNLRQTQAYTRAELDRLAGLLLRCSALKMPGDRDERAKPAG